jgi:hypothetical protein
VTKEETVLMLSARSLLHNAAGILRLEAQEWQDRRNQKPRGRDWTAEAWLDRCERIAETNMRAATAMSEHAEKIAEAVS